MPTDIVMPQMGESIFEGTITKWLKKPGEKVQRDEPLFEISTDKVDAEIPAPASGVLQEIKVSEGNTVQVNTVVGIIGDGDGSRAPASATPKAAAPAPPPASPKTEAAVVRRPRPPPALPRMKMKIPTCAHPRSSANSLARTMLILQKLVAPAQAVASPSKTSSISSSAARPLRLRLPLRRLNPSSCGSVSSGRYSRGPGAHVKHAQDHCAAHDRIAPHQRSRSLHVRSGLTRIVNLRNKLKNGFEQRHGARLTFMPFFVRGAIIALQQYPIVNSSLEGDSLRYHKHVNAGIAVALDWGLIVPFSRTPTS
jgi:pyruvate dehydrogenase E2 component (dihydrolipoamide acetyltransferase)